MRAKWLFCIAIASIGIFSISSGELPACNDETCFRFPGTARDGFDYMEDNNCPEGGCYVEKRLAGAECRGPHPNWDGQLCIPATYWAPFWYMHTNDCEPECDYSNSFWSESPTYQPVPTCNSAIPCDNYKYNWES
jgi:hypothetical protein